MRMVYIPPNLNITEIVSTEKEKSAGQNTTNPTLNNLLKNVTEERVQKVLAKLNPHKAPGPDNLPNWIFKEYSYLLALPVMKIINASYYEQQLPTIWKKANVSPLPKKKPVTILEKDLRPISLHL